MTYDMKNAISWHPYLEVRCPYSIEGNVTVELTPDETEEKYGKKFFMHRGDDKMLHLSETHPYYAQVQGEMAILNVEWCDCGIQQWLSNSLLHSS